MGRLKRVKKMFLGDAKYSGKSVNKMGRLKCVNKETFFFVSSRYQTFIYSLLVLVRLKKMFLGDANYSGKSVKKRAVSSF